MEEEKPAPPPAVPLPADFKYDVLANEILKAATTGAPELQGTAVALRNVLLGDQVTALVKNHFLIEEEHFLERLGEITRANRERDDERKKKDNKRQQKRLEELQAIVVELTTAKQGLDSSRTLLKTEALPVLKEIRRFEKTAEDLPEIQKEYALIRKGLADIVWTKRKEAAAKLTSAIGSLLMWGTFALVAATLASWAFHTFGGPSTWLGSTSSTSAHESLSSNESPTADLPPPLLSSSASAPNLPVVPKPAPTAKKPSLPHPMSFPSEQYPEEGAVDQSPASIPQSLASQPTSGIEPGCIRALKTGIRGSGTSNDPFTRTAKGRDYSCQEKRDGAPDSPYSQLCTCTWKLHTAP